MLKQVLLIRHGETDWNAEQRWQGHTDIPLNQTGVGQAEELAGSVTCSSLEVLISSDLIRAHETAQIIARQLSIPLFTEERLREVHVGRAEGLNHRQVVERFGAEAIVRWRSVDPHDLDFAFEHGETKGEALKRGVDALDQFLHLTEAKSIGVVTHGMLIRTMIHHLFPELNRPVAVRNCGCISLSYDTSRKNWELIGEVDHSLHEPRKLVSGGSVWFQ